MESKSSEAVVGVNPWKRVWLPLLVVTAFLVGEFGLSVYPEVLPGPAQFRWKMFDRIRHYPRFRLIRADGTMEPVELEDFVPTRRAGIAYEKLMPKHLCKLNVGVQAIEIEMPGGGRERVACLSGY